jgi:hypothetical protein
MSSERVVVTAESDESEREDTETCRTPNCWRDGVPVRVAGVTEVPAVLCERHRRIYLLGSGS